MTMISATRCISPGCRSPLPQLRTFTSATRCISPGCRSPLPQLHASSQRPGVFQPAVTPFPSLGVTCPAHNAKRAVAQVICQLTARVQYRHLGHKATVVEYVNALACPRPICSEEEATALPVIKIASNELVFLVPARDVGYTKVVANQSAEGCGELELERTARRHVLRQGRHNRRAQELRRCDCT